MSKAIPCVGDASLGGAKGGCGEIGTTGEFMPGFRGGPEDEQVGKWVDATENVKVWRMRR